MTILCLVHTFVVVILGEALVLWAPNSGMNNAHTRPILQYIALA